MKAKMNNMYESLIVQSILEEVSGEDMEVRQMLESLDDNKKRMAILSILDQNRGLFKQINNLVKENKVSSAKHIKQVVSMLREYVQVAPTEKKSLGEVMSPIFLVNDILNTLPNEVWSNPDLKWLDNSAGVGIFPAVIIERLMNGLKNFQQDEDLRYKHIIENMIYMSEYQSKNCFLLLTGIDPQIGEDNAVNIYNGSFLDEGFDKHAKEVWGVEKWNICVMNPPYQICQEGNKKTQPIWHLFVQKSLNILEEDGYLAAVHPSGWRNVDGVFKQTQKIMKEKQMLYLEIHSFKDGLKTFGAKIDYDFYCIKNTTNINTLTTIKCVDGSVVNINISDMEFIPSENIEAIYSLVAKDGEERVELLHSYSSYETRKEYMSKQQFGDFKYPCIYMIGFGQNIKSHFSKVDNKGHFNTPKVIWGNGATDVITDETGIYGLTQFAYAIVDDVENLENIKKALDNPKFIKGIMNYRDGLGDKYNRKVIALFRKDFWKKFVD
jgi:hypothetical protein